MTKQSNAVRPRTLVAASAVALGLVLAIALPASAATLNLPLSDVYPSKTYYTTPRIKATTGTATIKLTTINENCGAGGALHIGMRLNAGLYGESTQFPLVHGGATVQFRNPSAPPAHAYTFTGNGTPYYFTAQLSCDQSESATWKGTVVW